MGISVLFVIAVVVLLFSYLNFKNKQTFFPLSFRAYPRLCSDFSEKWLAWLLARTVLNEIIR